MFHSLSCQANEFGDPSGSSKGRNHGSCWEDGKAQKSVRIFGMACPNCRVACIAKRPDTKGMTGGDAP